MSALLHVEPTEKFRTQIQSKVCFRDVSVRQQSLGLVEVSHVQVVTAQANIIVSASGFQLQGSLKMFPRFFIAIEHRQQVRIAVVGPAEIWVDLQGTLIVAFGGDPVPIVGHVDDTLSRMDLRQRIVQFECLADCRLRPLSSLLVRETGRSRIQVGDTCIRQREIRIRSDRILEVWKGLAVGFRPVLPPPEPTIEIGEMSLRIVGMALSQLQTLLAGKLGHQRQSDGGGDRLLDLENVRFVLIKTITPEMPLVGDVGQFQTHDEAVALLGHAPSDNRIDIQCSGDIVEIDIRPAKLERQGAGGHDQLGQCGPQPIGDTLGDAITEVGRIRIAPDVFEGQHRYGMDRCGLSYRVRYRHHHLRDHERQADDYDDECRETEQQSFLVVVDDLAGDGGA